jgi:hypothetical protein
VPCRTPGPRGWRPAQCHRRPRPRGATTLSGKQMTPPRPRVPGGNCSTAPVIAGARGAICGQIMALDVHSSRPERRSDDGQTILKAALEGWKLGSHLGKLVELRGFEPRTSCMPSAGSTSTAVHLCRSPSQAVRISPPGSRPVAVLSCCTGQLGPSRYRWARDQLEPPRTLLRRFPGKQASPPQSPAPRPAHSKAVRGSAQTTGPRRRGITAGAARFQAPDGCIHGGGWRRATLRLSGHGS